MVNEERLRVLQMIEQGKISAAEGADLLSQLNGNADNELQDQPAAKPRWFRVHVTDLETGKNRVSVNIPLDLVEVGLRMGARFVPTWEPSDYAGVLESAENGATGQMVDEICGQERIEIFIE